MLLLLLRRENLMAGMANWRSMLGFLEVDLGLVGLEKQRDRSDGS